MARSFLHAGLRRIAPRRRPAAAPVAGGRIAPAGRGRGALDHGWFDRARPDRDWLGRDWLGRDWLGRVVARLHLGTFGNGCFLIGSVAFLSDASQTFGVWLFIAGSAAFLVDGLTRGHDR